MLIGIGIDMLDVRRVARLMLKFRRRFEQKFFTEREVELAGRRTRYVDSLAKMFSLKESVIKAISDVSGLTWHEIEVTHVGPKPSVILHGNALSRVLERANNFKIHASVSDEIPYVTSLVLIESI
jgi:holo-[acyl-carrier protein] synthase